MPVDLSWLDGSVEDAATMLADRAVASRALGGVVKAGERPAWADALMKEAALLKQAEPPVAPPAAPTPGGDFFDRNLGGLKKWVGEQAGAGIRDTFKQSPELQNAIAGGIAGAGIGAIGGLGATVFSKNKRKRPVANALFGGVLGGLGGAAMGGLGGAGGLFGKQRRQYQPGVTDPAIASASNSLNDRNEVTFAKTLRGLNNMNNSEVAKSFGYGAGLYGGSAAAGNTIGRFIPGVGYNRQHISADSLRRSLSPSTAAIASGWSTPGAVPSPDDVRTVGSVLKGSKDPVAAHLGTKGTDRDVVRAVTGKGWTARTPIEGRPALFGARTALNSGKAGILGAVIGGASKGIDMENAQAPAYVGALATGLRVRYGPTDEQVKKQLDDIIARTRSHGTTPMTSAEVNDYSDRLHRLKAQFEMDALKRFEAQRAAAGNPTGK